MKKVLLGCLGLMFVLGMAAIIGGYFFVWKPISGVVSDVSGFTQFEQDVQNQQPFVPPIDGQLTPEQVANYVYVQDQLDAAVGPRIDAVVAVFNAGKDGGVSAQGDGMEALRQLRDSLRTASEARNAQVGALNTRGLSVAEYRWIQSTIVQTVSVGSTLQGVQSTLEQGGNVDFSAAFEQAQTALGAGQQPGTPAPDAGDTAAGKPTSDGADGATDDGKPAAGGMNPAELAQQLNNPARQHNLALLEPYRARLSRWATYWAITL